MDGYQNRKCYASALGGCSKVLSGEHYISRGVLEFLDDGPAFSVTGLPWQTASTSKPSISSLAANILCSKHNSDLSPLDSECLKIFHFFRDAHDAIYKQNHTGEIVSEVSGDAIERWLLKAISGLVASGNAAKDGARIPKSRPPLGVLQMLWGQLAIPDGWGLYLLSQIGELVMQERAVQFAPLISDSKIIGAICHIHGFRFLLAMAIPAADRRGSLLENSIYRPAFLKFFSRRPNALGSANF